MLTMKEMALSKSPVHTVARLAADRANAQKSAGSSAPEGKTRVALNALRGGARTDGLQEKLLEWRRATRGSLARAPGGNYGHLWGSAGC